MIRWVVREIDETATHDLRRRVLRTGTPTDAVVFDGDEIGVHLGAFDGGRLLAVSSWIPSGFDRWPNAIRLRGMATDPADRGRGAGAALLASGLARCRDARVPVVWATARLAAVEIYRRHGFDPVGEVYLDSITTGLPHRLVTIELY